MECSLGKGLFLVLQDSLEEYQKLKYSSLPLSVENMFQDPQWMLETEDSTESCIYCVFSYTHIPTIEFILSIKQQ